MTFSRLSVPTVAPGPPVQVRVAYYSFPYNFAVDFTFTVRSVSSTSASRGLSSSEMDDLKEIWWSHSLKRRIM